MRAQSHSEDIDNAPGAANMTTAKTIAKMTATSPEGDTIEIICTCEFGYEVFINGGLLGDGTESAHYDTLGRALARMSDEAAACILGHYL